MIIKKNVIFFFILLLLNNCSFDNKTGIWGDSKKEKKRISDLEKKQKEIIKVEKVYESENIFKEEKTLSKNIILSKAKKNSSWTSSNFNNQNFLGNIYSSGVDNTFLRKKIGKDKHSIHKGMTPLLIFENNFLFSDDAGTIFSVNKVGKINWKKNIYKKIYKRIYKNLVFSVYKNNIYIADNIGFIYAIDQTNGKLLWIKNYGVPIKSELKVYKNKIILIDQDNKIVCLDTKDGSLVWNILTISSFIKSQSLLPLAISDNGDLFTVTSSADIFRINVSNGNVAWSRNAAQSLYVDATDFFTSSGLVITKDQIIFSSNFATFSFDVNTGATNWQNAVTSIDTPIIDGTNIFFVTKNGYFVIINKNTGKTISSTNILNILKKKKQKTQVQSFIMGSNKIYSTTLNGFLIVSSAETGKAEYFRKIKGANIAPLILSNGTLYTLIENSKLLGLN